MRAQALGVGVGLTAGSSEEWGYSPVPCSHMPTLNTHRFPLKRAFTHHGYSYCHSQSFKRKVKILFRVTEIDAVCESWGGSFQPRSQRPAWTLRWPLAP
jgi:hypothetical protein